MGEILRVVSYSIFSHHHFFLFLNESMIYSPTVAFLNFWPISALLEHPLANQIQRLELAVVQLLRYNYYRERAIKSYAFITPHSCPQDQATELSHQVPPILRGILETWISTVALSILTLTSHMCT